MSGKVLGCAARGAACLAKCLAGGVAFLLMGIQAQADEWYLEPEVRVQALANDNLTLDRGDKDEAVGGILSPQAKIGHRSETTDIGLTGHADLNGYVVNSDLSSVDYKFVFDATHQASELSTLGFQAQFSDDTIFDSPEDNTGDEQKDSRVRRISASPSWGYQFTELDRIDLTGSWLDQSYPDAGEDEDEGYTAYNTGAMWQHRVTEIDTLNGGLAYSRFEPDDPDDAESDIIDLKVGWSRDFSPNLRVQATAGPTYSITHSHRDDSGDFQPRSDQIGYNADVSLAYQMSERSNLVLSYGHKSEPSREGNREDRDRVGLQFAHRVTELSTFRISGTYIGNQSTSEDDEGTSFTQYFSVEPSFAWELQQDLELSVSYRFQHQMFEDPEDEATSNAVFLTLTYRPQRLTWSD
jgi:hypothetical protein